MTTEEALFNRVLALMQEVTVANGYSFDIRNVYDSRDIPLDESELPMFNVFDESNITDEEDELKRNLRIAINFEDVGDNSPAVNRSRKQDVLNAFKKIETEANVIGASFLGTETDIETKNKKSTAVQFLFNIEYQGERWTI